jgi:hypothetical protein
MQSLARTAAPAMRQTFRRGFAASAARGQAVPTEKPVVMKEFKIYRWVSVTSEAHGAGEVGEAHATQSYSASPAYPYFVLLLISSCRTPTSLRRSRCFSRTRLT